MLGPYWDANIALACVNMVLVAGLLYIYARNFGALRSKFALGLIAFSIILVLQNVAAVLDVLAACPNLLGRSRVTNPLNHWSRNNRLTVSVLGNLAMKANNRP